MIIQWLKVTSYPCLIVVGVKMGDVSNAIPTYLI